MMFVVDTNVLLYAANEDVPEHTACQVLVERWRVSPLAWFVSWKILYEFVRVVTHRQVFRTPWTAGEAFAFVSALLASPALQILSETPRHCQVALEVAEEIPLLGGNLVHDAHTAVLMREHGVRRVVTRDMDFHRFPWLEVVDPLQL